MLNGVNYTHMPIYSLLTVRSLLIMSHSFQVTFTQGTDVLSTTVSHVLLLVFLIVFTIVSHFQMNKLHNETYVAPWPLVFWIIFLLFVFSQEQCTSLNITVNVPVLAKSLIFNYWPDVKLAIKGALCNFLQA